MEDWKNKLDQIRDKLPKYEPQKRRLTKKEVITRVIEENVRISSNIIRKRKKMVTI